jgi:hypothetical protein
MLYHIYLDLDETLLNTPTLNSENLDKKIVKKCKKQIKVYKHEEGFLIFERPYLQEFLDFIFQYFIVSVFTAASKSYANFILKNIILKKKQRKLLYFFYNVHTDFIDKRMKIKHGIYSHKNLNELYDTFKLNIAKSIPLSKTYIIDNHSLVSVKQKSKHFSITNFEIPLKLKNHENDIKNSLADNKLLLMILDIKRFFLKKDFNFFAHTLKNPEYKHKRIMLGNKKCRLCNKNRNIITKTIFFQNTKIIEDNVCCLC